MKTFHIPATKKINARAQITVIWDGTPEGRYIYAVPVRAKSYRAAEIAVYGHKGRPLTEDQCPA